VVGAVEGAGVAPLEVELVDPDDDAFCVARFVAAVSCAADDMVTMEPCLRGKLCTQKGVFWWQQGSRDSHVAAVGFTGPSVGSRQNLYPSRKVLMCGRGL
jgi:hypothetical protein